MPHLINRRQKKSCIYYATILVVVTKPVIKVGSIVKFRGSKYLVTSKTTVALKKAKNVKIRTVTIGKNVKILKKYAFKSSRSTKMIVKTKLLKKSTVKGSLKGSIVRTVQVKIGTKKVNKTYVNKYNKIFTRENAGKKVRVI